MGDQLGFSVCGAGDVNDDGSADLLVGAPKDDNNVTNSGSARVLSGKYGRILWTFNGDLAGELFGQSVSGTGDLTSDGIADLLVGAPQDDKNGHASGSARLFVGGASPGSVDSFDGDSAADQLGFSVSGAGDMNNDGYDDVIVGARYDDDGGLDSGAAFIFFGAAAPAATIDASAAAVILVGGDPGDRFGFSVSSAGDVNGDGYDGVLVGAY